MPNPPTRPWLVAAALLLAPLSACLVSGGDGTPSSISEGSPRHPAGGGTWSNGGNGGNSGATTTDAGVGDAVPDATRPTDGRSDGAPSPQACTTGANAAFALAWTVSGGAPDGGVPDAAVGDASDGPASDGAVSDGPASATACGVAGANAVDVDVVNLVTGAESGTTVSCDSLALTTCPLPRGSYAISLALKNAAGATLSETIAPELVIENGQTAHLPSLPFEVGAAAASARGFALTWSIEDATTGAARTCVQASATTLRLEASAKTFDLPCGAGQGRTPALPAGEYSVKLSLLDAQGAARSVTGSMLLRIKNGQLIFLGNAVFDVL